MARKVITHTATDGRDSGKVFQITEMPSSKAEKWAIRALMALGRGGIDLPEDPACLGWHALASIGFTAMVSGSYFVEIEPLLDEMMGCIKIVPSPSNPDVVRSLVEDDIEEIATRFKLRKDVFNLHADFLRAVAPLISESGAAA